jgi:hypothetical protein
LLFVRKNNVLLAKKSFSSVLSLAISAAMLFVSGAAPAWAQPKEPFMVSSPLNATVPFNVTLPTTTPDGKAVKTVVIEFVTADCDAPPATSAIGSAQITVLFNGQNGFYHIAFGQPQVFVNTTEFVFTQPTLMFADPGTPVTFGITGAAPSCTVVFSGHLITK